LKGEILPYYSLVDKMGEHASGRHADDFVVALEGSLKLDDDSFGD
jgi:hypothetical protein